MKEINDILIQNNSKISDLKQKTDTILVPIDINKDILEQLDSEKIKELEQLLNIIKNPQSKKNDIFKSLDYYKRNLEAGINLSLLLIKDQKCLKLIDDIKVLCNEALLLKQRNLEEIRLLNETINKLKFIVELDKEIDITEMLMIIEPLNISFEDKLEIYKYSLIKNLNIAKENNNNVKSEGIEDEENITIEENISEEIEKGIEEYGAALTLSDDDISLKAKIKELQFRLKRVSIVAGNDSKFHFNRLKLNKLVGDYEGYLELKNGCLESDSKSILMENYEEYLEKYEMIKEEVEKLEENFSILLEKNSFSKEYMADTFEDFLKNRERLKKHNVVFSKKAYKEFFDLFKPGSKDIGLPFINGMLKALEVLETKDAKDLQEDLLSSKLAGSTEDAFEYKVHTPANGGAYRVIYYNFSSGIIIPKILFKNEPRDAHVALRQADDFISQSRKSSSKTNVEIDEILTNLSNKNLYEYEKRIIEIYEKLYIEKNKRMGIGGENNDFVKGKSKHL